MTDCVRCNYYPLWSATLVKISCSVYHFGGEFRLKMFLVVYKYTRELRTGNARYCVKTSCIASLTSNSYLNTHCSSGKRWPFTVCLSTKESYGLTCLYLFLVELSFEHPLRRDQILDIYLIFNNNTNTTRVVHYCSSPVNCFIIFVITPSLIYIYLYSTLSVFTADIW